MYARSFQLWMMGAVGRLSDAIFRYSQRFSGRVWWWVSLGLLLAGCAAAYSIHYSGLSVFLQRIDPVATSKAALIAVAATTIFGMMSYRRAKEIGARPKLLLTSLVIVPIPFWILALGSLPTKSENSPNPFNSLVRKLVAAAVSCSVAGLAAGLAYITLVPWDDSVRRENSGDPASTGQSLPDEKDCYEKGVSYYKEIDSYPYLRSTGEFAPDVVVEMCMNSTLAFGR